MASLALGLAGAGIGSFFGPWGTSIGWGLGVMLGGRLGAKSHQSPQIKDLRVQTSEYGTPIPIGYGTIRIAGWLEWAADKVPHKHKQGGKGGPKVTTTTYSCSFAVGLLETSFLDYAGTLVNNPILGILRIWANGRLVYGEGSPADALPMVIYYGTEDQLPDPTIEAEEGVGEVSANRGKAYVVFTDLELAQFGDAIPNFTFEVVASGAIGMEYYALWPLDYSFPVDATTYAHPYTLAGVERTDSNEITMHRTRSGSDYAPGTGTDGDNTLYYDASRFDLHGNLIATEAQVTATVTAPFGIHMIPSMNSGHAYAWWLQDGGGTIETAFLNKGVVTVNNIDAPGVTGPMQFVGGGNILYWNGFLYALGGTGGSLWLRRWPAADGNVYEPTADIELGLSGYSPFSIGASPFDLMLGDDGHLYVRLALDPIGGVLLKIDANLVIVFEWYDNLTSTFPAIGTPGYKSAAIWRGHIIAYHSTGHILTGNTVFGMWRLNGDGTFTFVDELNADGIDLAAGSATVYIGSNLAAFRGGLITLGSGTITLGEMVANVSQHVGYAPDEYDVTELTDLVRGACVSQRTSGRAAIEAWQPAYAFGAVESNFANKFVKWGGDVVATIPDGDLGARPYGSDGGDPVKRTLTTDKDLPRTVEVVFLNKAMDYQEGMQYWEGPVQSDTRVALTMALVLTDSEGKAVAENIGVNALVERQKFEFSLPRKYCALEPTDVISINETPVRIVKKDEQGYTHIALEGISTRIGEWIVAPPAAQVDYVPQVPPNTVRTDLLLLDTALARDADAQLGFNSAMAGTMAGPWPGAGLYRSVDGGAEYELITAAAEGDVIGVATSVLGDFGGGNIVDESNILTVRLTPGSGDLASTNYLGLINGTNLFALGTPAGGWELAQFRDATLISTTSGGAKTYELAGLLRGRRGTEWAIDTHALNDKFVLLPAHNVDGEFADLGAEYLYKAVTSGSTLSSATAVPFTNNGMALKPYSPVLIGGGRNASGDIIINWARRTRLGGAWANNTDVPLGEDVESYILNFYTDATFATLVYSDTATTATYTLPAADQTLNFGGLENPLHVGIQQLGSYGYGTEGFAII